MALVRTPNIAKPSARSHSCLTLPHCRCREKDVSIRLQEKNPSLHSRIHNVCYTPVVMFYRTQTRHALRQPLILLIGVLCVSVFCQILGLAISFLNLEGSSDLIEASQLEGFSIASTPMTHTVMPQHLVGLTTLKPNYGYSSLRS